MKPTTTIAVLCLVVAGASAMNLPWNHKSDSSDAAGSSKSSTQRFKIRMEWLKKAFRPCGRRSRKCTSSEENLSDPNDTYEEQQGIDNPLSEENDASPM
ncbi:hypothetical protein BASA83_012019 [Batrachochytrium salamandrivorans]|nr:hypothetical protein BASA83_012019 [Batrachochytrium salamandrivorans]